ncbi:DUF503 domain-containing protein [Fusibacter sp. A1]|nr:DUF503 domain-containing protein [Fusibacter sp. A1]
MEEDLMTIAVMTVILYTPMCHDLKCKRRIVKSTKDKLSGHFNVSVAECDYHEDYHRALIGIAMIGSDARYLEAKIQTVINFLEKTVTVDFDIVEQTIEKW